MNETTRFRILVLLAVFAATSCAFAQDIYTLPSTPDLPPAFTTPPPAPMPQQPSPFQFIPNGGPGGTVLYNDQAGNTYTAGGTVQGTGWVGVSHSDGDNSRVSGSATFDQNGNAGLKATIKLPLN